jgi:hypothetical protein
MKKKILYTILIFVLCFGGYIYYRVSKPRPGLDNVTPALSITAVELYKQYQTNESAADSQFLKKVIEVTGVVADIQGTDSTLNIELQGGDMGGVNCGIADANIKTNSLQKGSIVKLKGECKGFIMDVLLNDCVIEDKH